jgi:hypothetical protein
MFDFFNKTNDQSWLKSQRSQIFKNGGSAIFFYKVWVILWEPIDRHEAQVTVPHRSPQSLAAFLSRVSHSLKFWSKHYKKHRRSSVITNEHTFIIDKVIEEYNTDEYMPLYSSVSKNIKVYYLTDEYIRIYSSVTHNRGIYWDPPCPYIPRLTKKYIDFFI